MPVGKKVPINKRFDHCVWSLQVSNESTYQEVVRATCGKVTGVLCEISIAIYTFGTCIAFFIVIGDQLERRKRAHTHPHNSHLGGTVLLSFCGSRDNSSIDEVKECKAGRHSALSDH